MKKGLPPIKLTRGSIQKAYDGKSPPVHKEVPPTLQDCIRRIKNPIQRTSQLSERDKNLLQLLLKKNGKSGKFDPSSVHIAADLGVLSRLSSLGMIYTDNEACFVTGKVSDYDLDTSPMILCRTGWMDQYNGDFGSWKGRHRFIVEGRGLPHEAFNFRAASDGNVYGFVQISKEAALNVSRLGAPATSDKITGVTVVWCSQYRGDKGLRVNGWYKNAIVFRDGIVRPEDKNFDQKIRARFKTKNGDAFLLGETERTFQIPSRTLGMADIFYIDENSPKLSKQLRRYIGQYGATETDGDRLVTKLLYGSSSEDKKRVEETAIKAAKKFLVEKIGATHIRDRQKDKCGWDLEAHTPKGILRVEVKGRGREQPVIALTINEYKAFKYAENDAGLAATYRLLTVNNATSAIPEIGFFDFRGGAWTCEVSKRTLRADVMELAFVNLVRTG